ncbi:MAG: hypothetical protein M1826_003170 [Phylliscum demangeonii]|nr:MAG: hypothetical protein M1826_003170 [Phylliscum demangeonii]
MASIMQTPQRPLPGAFLTTPARTRDPTLAPQAAASGSVLYPSLDASASQLSKVQFSDAPAATVPVSLDNLKPLQRAAVTINETLNRETRYPEIDSYVGQGISSDYDIPSSPAWAPFLKTKSYDIPEKILEQHNRAQVSTMMGLFAELNHAWIAIDNSLYLWDYTHPNPGIIGFEEQANSITAVKLAVPRRGVFTPQITHVLVVATAADIILVGLSCVQDQAGNNLVSLYQTRMHLSIRGMAVTVIEGSAATGRIFFANAVDNDIYELTYQQEEKWFQSRCGKINHTATRMSALVPALAALTPALPFASRPQEHIVQMATDDSRGLLYTLSSKSTINTFHMQSNNGLERTISLSLSEMFASVGHMVSQTELLGPTVSIRSISPIAALEAQKLHLMATTSTGCRLFLSATASAGWAWPGGQGAPTSMRLQHIKFPPPPQGLPSPQVHASPQSGAYQASFVDTQSKSLSSTRTAQRFPPGYFFCVTASENQRAVDTLFLSSPDSGRIAQARDAPPATTSQFPETGLWLNLDGHAEDMGLMSAPFVAATSPLGFGNELAIQFDKPPAEIAILTNTGVLVIRRRRPVDIFAAAIQYAGREQALEGDVRKFVRMYGRGETTATALAVACGQGEDLGPEVRIARMTGPEVLDAARKAFIEFGGNPTLNENYEVEKNRPAIDNVRPSHRHEGIALYISRLIRSIWKAPILSALLTTTGGVTFVPTVGLAKLRGIQRDLSRLQEFLKANQSSIEGLAGPESLSRGTSTQPEIALLAEHRALHSLVVLLGNVVEGISFVLVLFDERVEEIVYSLSDDSRQRVQRLSFEGLFTTDDGKELAKELVKAIVNRNIASGSNVDTVAEALRRRCGSFCSADDVVIFKAQENLKKASEMGSSSEPGRRLLNESLRLFQQVAASLSMEQLQWVILQFISMEFYAGGIQLALTVAQEKDRGNRALLWMKDGKREDDPRYEAYAQRTQIYQLIRDIINRVDQSSREFPETIDGGYTPAAKRRSEAYAIIDDSEDELFHYDLYDWYSDNGWSDRLLAVRSPFVVSYLQRRAKQSVRHADLLWRYFAQGQRYHDASAVQLRLAKGNEFHLPLDKRIEYLSKAKANASIFTPGVARQPRQVLLHEITELLDVANIQDDLLQRLRQDERIPPERKPDILSKLDEQILGLTELYNEYADQASYFDICLLIYKSADHRNTADIKATWQNLIDQIHKETLRRGEPQPWEAVAERVRSLGNRLHLSETTFPIGVLLSMLEKYAFEYQHPQQPAQASSSSLPSSQDDQDRSHDRLLASPPKAWVIDTFLDVGVSPDTLLPILESMIYNDEAPFAGRNRAWIAADVLSLCQRWYATVVARIGVGAAVGDAAAAASRFGRSSTGSAAGAGAGPGVGGSADEVKTMATGISHLLLVLLQNGLVQGPAAIEECQILRARVEALLR